MQHVAHDQHQLRMLDYLGWQPREIFTGCMGTVTYFALWVLMHIVLVRLRNEHYFTGDSMPLFVTVTLLDMWSLKIGDEEKCRTSETMNTNGYIRERRLAFPSFDNSVALRLLP